MASRVMTNVLLLLVVLLLGVISMNMYNLLPRVPMAEAASSDAFMLGCFKTNASDPCSWRPIRVTADGVIFTTK